MSYSLVFLLSSQSSCIVPASSVTGGSHVGDVATVKWKGCSCKAKVLYTGPKELCEIKSTAVNAEGELVEDLFDVSIPNFHDANLWQEISRSGSPESKRIRKQIPTLTEIADNVASLKELVQQMYSMIVSIDQSQKRLEEMMEELLKRCPAKTSLGSIDYTYVSEKDVATLRELKGQNFNAFALALEKMVYQDDPAELEIAVDKRIRSLDRLVFIQQCVFKYYDVPENVQKDVWALVKDSLNSRARRLRKALRDEESVLNSRSCHKEELPDQLILFE